MIRHTILFFKLVIMNVAISKSISSGILITFNTGIESKLQTLYNVPNRGLLFVHIVQLPSLLLLLQISDKAPHHLDFYLLFPVISQDLGVWKSFTFIMSLPSYQWLWAVSTLCKEKAEEKVESTWSAPFLTCSPVNCSFRHRWHLILYSTILSRGQVPVRGLVTPSIIWFYSLSLFMGVTTFKQK